MNIKNSQLYQSLVDSKILDEKALRQASEQAAMDGKRLSTILLDSNYLPDEELAKFIINHLEIETTELNKSQMDTKLASVIPEELARKHHVVPLFVVNNTVTIAVINALDVRALEEIEIQTGLILNVVQAKKETISSLLDHLYLSASSSESSDLDTIFNQGMDLVRKKSSEDDLEDVISEAPIAKLVDRILKQAIAEKASDIHIEPEENSLRIRYRVDGVMSEAMSPPKMLEAAVISRLKVITGMDITERRKPQDGRLTIDLNDRTIDFRVSTVRTAWGEKMVLRILDKSSIIVEMDKLGFNEGVYKQFNDSIVKNAGIILVTGPTGSGKTTTLYSALAKLNSPEKNIVTIEDPVEYNLANINQIPVNAKIGVTFAAGLRTILRQDPDIVMIGEIRDMETGTIAVQAAQTGHLVLSTLHTNNAPAAVTRLVDMGIKPFMIVSSVIGIMAQRLVRKICPSCRREYQLSPKEESKYAAFLKDLREKHKDAKVFKGQGCKQCGGRGYRGRLGIFEYFEIDQDLQDLIMKGATTDELRNFLHTERDMQTMYEDGLDKIQKGITTLEEVYRVMLE